MNLIIALYDLLAIIFILSALIIIFLRFKKWEYSKSSPALFNLIGVSLIYSFLNFMEWAGFGTIYDEYGDFVGVLIPMSWAFSFYALLQEKLAHDVSESEERYKNLSLHDGLTGLYNRAYFEEEINRINKDISRFKPVTIFSIDIDGLKLINDTLGHAEGDYLIIKAASIISTTFRAIDIVARIGGDEFAAVIPYLDKNNAIAKEKEIERLTKEYNESKPVIPLKLSVGSCTSGDIAGESIFEILREADNRMYQQKVKKESGRASSSVELLLSALEERDFITQGHADRLSKMAEKVAEHLGLNVDQKNNLVLFAKLHDIGKIGVSDTILFKQAALSKSEYDEMKKHSVIGHRIANHSKDLQSISDLILHHHESWDGSGYPSGLKGMQIPIECRILAVLDAYDAMTNVRPYRQPMSKEDAIDELKKCSGTKFDPKIIEAFLESLNLEEL